MGADKRAATAMRVDQFDFDLQEERIALYPARPRDAARLLVVTAGGRLTDRTFLDFASHLRPGDALVLNDTRVIRAELHGVRPRGESSARVRATLIKRTGPDTWDALARPAKRMAAGETLQFSGEGAGEILSAEITDKHDGGRVSLRFERTGPALDTAIAAIGHIPLPPYIAGRRDEAEDDAADYQTMFAARDGAVAAPTAGLHFTERVMTSLAERDVAIHKVTLHVGAGTFLPVKADNTDDHVMHAEWGEVSAETAAALNRTRAAGGRIIALGTTSLRLLESAVDDKGTIHPFAGETSIFLTPGSNFRAVDGLLTNFHLPRSTLFMLVCALSGTDAMKHAYQHAIDAGYRFYSYGDACLLLPKDET